MSADEDKYFNIPIDRTVEELRNILEKNYSEILKIDFLKMKIIRTFGSFQKIRKNQD